MMNHRMDSFKFYSSIPMQNSQQLSSDDTNTFTESKTTRKKTISKDSQVIVESKLIDEKEAFALWTGIILRSAVDQKPSINHKKENKSSKEDIKGNITTSSTS
ncbi:hypothetical protein PENTCL1PPCAC_1229, partial [Pristionchus entomophagus]